MVNLRIFGEKFKIFLNKIYSTKLFRYFFFIFDSLMTVKSFFDQLWLLMLR